MTAGHKTVRLRARVVVVAPDVATMLPPGQIAGLTCKLAVFARKDSMKLGLGIGAFGPPGGARIVELAKEAESLGYDTIWAPEIYGADCFTPLTWIAAHTERINVGSSIMQISARTAGRRRHARGLAGLPVQRALDP